MAVCDRLEMYGDTEQPPVNIDITEYAGLVKRIAQHMLARMPSCVQLEDLIQAGMIGLLEASRKYDPSQGASFETYAGIRIRGSIVDEIRKGDWSPRSVHRNSRSITEAMNRVENRLGRDASDQEVADEMGVEIEEYHRMARDTMGTRLFSLEEACSDDDSRMPSSQNSISFLSPQEGVTREGLKNSLAQAISNLPERERMVLSLYYDEELNLKEIGMVLGVSESRVSQIHSQAAARLRARLADWNPTD
ncbi:MAG: RNA polymerase sigma factor FliA [Cellvibrionaceae bacterium]